MRAELCGGWRGLISSTFVILQRVFYDHMATIARKDKEQSLFLRIPRFADALVRILMSVDDEKELEDSLLDGRVALQDHS